MAVPFGAGLSHSALLLAVFDPIGLWPLALIAIAPLAWAASRPRPEGMSPLAEFAALWLGAMPFFLLQQAWVIDVSVAGYPFMAAYLSLYAPTAVVIMRRTQAVLPPWAVGISHGMLWTALEVFRGDVAFKGYAWFNVAHPIAESPALAAAAAVTGVYGITLLVSIIGGSAGVCLARGDRAANTAVAAAAAVAWGVLAVSGWKATPEPDPRREAFIRVGIVQTNLPQSNKVSPDLDTTLDLWRDLERYTLAAASSTPAPDLIVWPETMKPGMALDQHSVEAERRAGVALFPADPGSSRPPIATADFADATIELQRRTGIPLLVGEDAYDDLKIIPGPSGRLEVSYARRFNSAFLITQGQVRRERYDKVRLTPFGEEMPYISLWPALQSRLLDLAASGMRLDLSSGSELTVFRVPIAGGRQVRIVTPICFEATESDLCRRMVHDGSTRRADLMVNMTNDGWFGWWRAGRRQHLLLARWRCIELATPMVRAANTGISCSIDARGRVRPIAIGANATDWNAAGLLLADISMPVSVTPMARGGWVLGWVCLVAGSLQVAFLLIPRPVSNRTRTGNLA
ncbi:MAG TPA: apolipoprotein N-acyltransferase [Phycisphaerales bacterium]|nr:apolipoprotein N-acyltransferase [Phycisphaerales bacterium]